MAEFDWDTNDWLSDSSNWSGLPNTDYWSSLYASDYNTISPEEWAVFEQYGFDPYSVWTSPDYSPLTSAELAAFEQTGIDPYNPSSSAILAALRQMASASGKTIGEIAEALKSSGLGTLAGMLGAGYGISNQYDWQKLLGQGRDLAEKTGTLISGYQPYTNQMVNMSEAQKQAAGYAPDILSQSKNWFTGAGTYDPTQIQKYLNPYVEGGLAAANRLTTQNLTENILPGINSTFVGQGQFGSARNAEFQNRAIRDTQQSIADANAKAMVGAYGNADTAYRDMLAKQGQLGQQGFQMGLGLANIPVSQYKDMYQSPLEMFKTWSTGVGSFNPAGANTASSITSDLSKLFGA